MFRTITQDYNLGDATMEILAMLFGAFVLGYLLHSLLHRCKFSGEEIADVTSTDENDLKVVEGIGPKIEEILKSDGIATWSDLADASDDRLKKVLGDAGDRFRMHDSKTWSEQAGMARDGKWRELKKYQDFLIGGK